MVLRSRAHRSQLRQIVFRAASLIVVASMVIARVRRGLRPVPPSVPPVQERTPWCELRERRLELPRDQPGVRAVVVAVALLIAVAGGVIGLGRHFSPAALAARTTVGFEPVTASAGVLDVGVACTAAAWALVISGLFLAR
jgi:hypothetical protein